MTKMLWVTTSDKEQLCYFLYVSHMWRSGWTIYFHITSPRLPSPHSRYPVTNLYQDTSYSDRLTPLIVTKHMCGHDVDRIYLGMRFNSLMWYNYMLLFLYIYWYLQLPLTAPFQLHDSSLACSPIVLSKRKSGSTLFLMCVLLSTSCDYFLSSTEIL